MGINWRVRLRSYPFWVALFALIGLIVSDLELMTAGAYQNYVDAVLVLLVAGGIITDHTTEGVKDSKQALSYDKPRKDDWA